MSEPLRVELAGAESASGLADLLHQFLEQTVEASPRKAAQARALRGEVVVIAAEDTDVAVRIAFLGDRIELADLRGEKAGASPSIQGDFLSVAHVTSGQASPMALVLQRKLRVSFGVMQLPFLWRVLGLMRIDEGDVARRRPLVLVLVVVLLVALALVLLYSRLRP